MTTDRDPLAPSYRGLANLRPSLMQDLSREVEKFTPYDRRDHPEGLLDMTSSINTLMTREIDEYVKKNVTYEQNDGINLSVRSKHVLTISAQYCNTVQSQVQGLFEMELHASSTTAFT